MQGLMIRVRFIVILNSKKDKKMSGIGQTSNDEHVVAIREITR